MGLNEDLVSYVANTHASAWARRDGQKVPESQDLTLGNDAVDLEGTVLYADLAESSALVSGYKDWFSSEIYKNYLYCAAKLIVHNGGVVTAYDGDRVMGVFIGDSKNNFAVMCALNINYAVMKILRPAILKRYPNDKYLLSQRVGVDTSKLMVARTGIRGSNDLVWVGSAANTAAKLAALSSGYSTYISEVVFSNLQNELLVAGNPSQNMWDQVNQTTLPIKVLGSTYWYSF